MYVANRVPGLRYYQQSGRSEFCRSVKFSEENPMQFRRNRWDLLSSSKALQVSNNGQSNHYQVNPDKPGSSMAVSESDQVEFKRALSSFQNSNVERDASQTHSSQDNTRPFKIWEWWRSLWVSELCAENSWWGDCKHWWISLDGNVVVRAEWVVE